MGKLCRDIHKVFLTLEFKTLEGLLEGKSEVTNGSQSLIVRRACGNRLRSLGIRSSEFHG
jgi:hypothetical protein